jgi:flavin reductase (DIM6/NTAB) family NADH-FMN oxidoreductase RutF
MMQEETQAQDEALRTAFRDAMGNLAAGVVMVTTALDGRPWGMTVSACCSVSVDPPMLLVSLSQTTASVHAISESQRFGVSVLGSRALQTAKFGAARGAPKFIETFCREGCESATPAVVNAIAHVDCRVAETVHAGDHVIFIGDVVCVVGNDDPDSPLVYHDRRYHRLTEDSDVGAAPASLLWL